MPPRTISSFHQGQSHHVIRQYLVNASFIHLLSLKRENETNSPSSICRLYYHASHKKIPIIFKSVSIKSTLSSNILCVGVFSFSSLIFIKFQSSPCTSCLLEHSCNIRGLSLKYLFVCLSFLQFLCACMNISFLPAVFFPQKRIWNHPWHIISFPKICQDVWQAWVISIKWVLGTSRLWLFDL